MLIQTRKYSNGIIVKILLGLIALSFLIAGISSFGISSQSEMVSFSDAEPISIEQFQRARSLEIDAIQRKNGINLSQSDIASMQIDQIVLHHLIKNSMIKYLAKCYDLDVSDDFVMKVIRTIPNLQNQTMENVKHSLITDTLYAILVKPFVTTNTMVENIVDYMSETRTVSIVSIDLNHKIKTYTKRIFATKELEDLYQNNQQDFINPEFRNFDYVKIDKNSLLKKLQISDKELKQFYEENKSDFKTAKNFKDAQKEVQKIVANEKIDQLLNELAQKLEEDVASGFTLDEIAKKYDLKINVAKDISRKNAVANQKQDYYELMDTIFDMAEGEVSYPISMQNQNEIFIISLKSIIQSRLRTFSEAKEEIESKIQQIELGKANEKYLAEIQKNYNSKTVLQNDVSVVSKSITRSELQLHDKLPDSLLNAIFEIKKNDSTQIIADNEKIYFAYIKDIQNNKSKAAKIKEMSGARFARTINEGLFLELISHLVRKNKVNIRQD